MAEHSAMLNAVVEALKLVGGADGSASGAGRSMLRMLYERTLGDSEAAQDVLAFVSGATQGTLKSATGAGATPKLSPPPNATCASTGRPLDVRFFSWQLSYFSGKVRAYLRFKARGADRLVFDEVNASPALVAQLLVPLTHTNVVPQLQLPDGSFVQDSSDIIEAVEARFPKDPVVPDPQLAPRQRLVCKLLELFGDEWLITAAFHWRWAYSGDGSAGQQLPAPPLATGATGATGACARPNHRAYNELQWGDFIAPPDASPARRRRAGAMLIDNVLLSEHGARGGLRALGVGSPAMAAAFEDAALHFLAAFEAHLAGGASFVLGHRPSLADYGLCGPLYAHLYADPVPGFVMRTRFPLVAQWCERLHDRGGQFFAQRRAIFDEESGELLDEPAVGGGAGHNGTGAWYADDHVPPSVVAMLRSFFDEMWPVMVSTMRVMAKYRGNASSPLPSKSFSPTTTDQMGVGPLTHEFELPDYTGAARGAPGGALRGRRMVVPYHLYMLQGLCDNYLAPARAACGDGALASFLRECGDPQGGDGRTPSLMELPELLSRCRVVKRGGKIYRAPAAAAAARAKL